MVKNVLLREAPSTQAASLKRGSTDSKAAKKGCTAKGRIYRIEANTNPGNVNGKVLPNRS